MDARLIVDPPAPGAWNMAVDEALLQSAQRSRQITLRLYQWSVPTLTLGYFQSAVDRQVHPSSHDCPLVRRSTGGGAIVHDQELTYSLVAPIEDDRSAVSQKLVQLVHAALIDVLRSFGIQAYRHDSRIDGLENRPSSQSVRRTDSQSVPDFLCFRRRAADDVVIGEHKIAGSAQRRLHGTLLQHGSVLLGRSPAAPELPGIVELATSDISLRQVLDAWPILLGEKLQCRFQTAIRTHAEDQLASHLEQAKFATRQWNLKR